MDSSIFSFLLRKKKNSLSGRCTFRSVVQALWNNFKRLLGRNVAFVFFLFSFSFLVNLILIKTLWVWKFWPRHTKLVCLKQSKENYARVT